ncbi:MAG TPA: MotA/TolQ/ExbB proton channel family protein [Polyangiaceae bacterium]|nr:MotA/TolQ/ExbB proton channel family protein [Polyangiaceae bacterium]
MIARITRLMVHSGALWVLWLLFALSVVSVAIALERAWVFRRAGGNLVALIPQLRALLRRGDLDGASALLSQEPSVESRVALAGLAELDLGATAAQEAMAAAMGLERRRLEKRLLFLGTVGNNAPFIGLLGTVIGVVGAFDALGRPDAMAGTLAGGASLAPERVMGTIAEALVATAVGLLVAIPAVAVFNYFQGRVTAALTDAETLGHVVLAHLAGAKTEDRAGSAAVARETVEHRSLRDEPLAG